MPACCVSYCNNRTERGFRHFLLPQGDRNKERRDAWIRNIKRHDLSSKSYVCEVHFDYNQFENHREDGKRTLKNNALPTLFREDHLEKEFDEDRDEDYARGTRKSTRKRKPVILDEYQFEDEDLESSQSDNIKKEADHSSDDKEMEPEKKIELIRCRTCLAIAPKEFSHVLKKMMLGKTIKQVISICVPQMELLDDEYICDKCFRFISKLMVFIDNCLESEEQLGSGKVSLEIDSSDLAGTAFELDGMGLYINTTPYRSVTKKRGRPRKYPLVIKEDDDEDYEPVNVSDKTPKKRGRKRKVDVIEVSDGEKEDENAEGPIGVKWGIPIADGKTFVVRKYGKPKTTKDQPVIKHESAIATVDLCVEPNDSNAFVENTDVQDGNEMFVEAQMNNMLTEPTEETDSDSVDVMIDGLPTKEKENNSIFADHSYVTEDLMQLLRCPLCLTDYRTLRGIKLHLTAAHKIAEEQSFECSLCSMKFIRYKDMIKHKSTHGHACELCEDFFATTAELDSHRSLHPEKYCCVKCGTKFEKKSLLEKHVPLHQMMSKIRLLIKNVGRPSLSCPHCNLKCTYASALQQHINTVHLKIKEFECGACQKRFSTNHSLKVHVRVRHSTDTPYVCQECGMGYGRLDYLQRHEQIHLSKHNPFVNPAKKNYSKVSSNIDTTFACIFCSVKTTSKAALLAHLHIHRNLRKYECDYCGLIFSCQSTKLSHESTHQNSEFDYVCTSCWKKFSTEHELKTHEELHECTSDTFTCMICNFTYARRTQLETHTFSEHIENNSEVNIVEANRRIIEIEWSTDEEEEEELVKHNSDEEKMQATGVIYLKTENTSSEKLNQEVVVEEKEEYILGMEDRNMEAVVENSDCQTEKETPDEIEEMLSQKVQEIESIQKIHLESLELGECIITVEGKTEQISLNAVNDNNHISQENEKTITENKEKQSLDHTTDKKQSENDRSGNIVIVLED